MEKAVGLIFPMKMGASYEPGALTVTTTFRRTVTCGSETASSEITITVLEGGTSTPIIIGTPANGLSLTDQVLTLDAASSTSTGALTSIDWNTFNSNDYYGYWWFQAGTGANAAIGSGDKISLVAGDGYCHYRICFYRWKRQGCNIFCYWRWNSK